MAVDVLRFGIPSLDHLCGKPDKDSPEGMGIHGATSMCIIGGDGTGKSVLGLHMASRYLADRLHQYQEAKNDLPRVLYASSDLSHGVAQNMWSNFRLNEPNKRFTCFCENADFRKWGFVDIKLNRYKPLPHDGEEWLLNCLHAPNDGSEVAFIDLSACTAGDDWGFLSRVLAVLNEPKNEDAKHLLIIDSVDGLETFVGDKDAYGEPRNRRSRIAQILRTAADKCHVVFLLEEPEHGAHAPEEYVTDSVIHLRSEVKEGYTRRSVEIEKARAQTHILGRHPYVIRDGSGSSELRWPNMDDPYVPGKDFKSQSYFHVFHSLHCLEQDIKGGSSIDRKGIAKFGIEYLDNMLSKNGGVPRGSMTAIIGEDGTYKARLGRAFLSQCFASDKTKSIAVLIAAGNISRDDLTKKIKEHLGDGDVFKDERLVYRRLETRHYTTEALVHLIQQTVRHAQARLDLILDNKSLINKNVEKQMRKGHSPRKGAKCGEIRLVIDNYSTIMDSYPEVAKDPLFLRYLHDFLADQGITSLVLDTQVANPAHDVSSDRDEGLRSIADNVIYTWHVGFMGERRVAITNLPPIASGSPTVVRELMTKETKGDEALDVHPDFELYEGLDKLDADPHPIPLKVHLLGGVKSEKMNPYLEQVCKWFDQIFRVDSSDKVVVLDTSDDYRNLRDLCQVQRSTQMDSSLVLQVDEFWSEARSALRLQKDYLTKPTVDADGNPNHAEDPHSVFQLRHDQNMVQDQTRPPKKEKKSWIRQDFFPVLGHNYNDYWRKKVPIDRIPYTWDFGMLLCKREAWYEARKDRITLNYETDKKGQKGETHGTVQDIWERLYKCGVDDVGSVKPFVTWRDFLRATVQVAESRSGETTYPLDIHMMTPETFSCLVLEIWASEIQLSCSMTQTTWPFAMPRDKSVHDQSISEYLTNDNYREALFRTWLLLGEALSPAQFESQALVFTPRPVKAGAVSARHWYSTAAETPPPDDPKDAWVPIRLPGTFSVRGDWFLGIGKGSRSVRLAQHAMDLLSTRRGNAERLQYGIGLPTRDLYPDDYKCSESQLWTPLSYVDGRWNRLDLTNLNEDKIRPVLYGDILKLAEPYNQAFEHERCHPTQVQKYHWIWRSALDGYDRHNNIWSKWLCRMLSDWPLMIQ
ncbi:MAG: hypothetical protein NT018_08990, partial [Armatimonadetes bacterium]|nr:hypothetical protein [Armatimonadota bacterium]